MYPTLLLSVCAALPSTLALRRSSEAVVPAGWPAGAVRPHSNGSIPRIIWVTGRWAPDSYDVTEIAKNNIESQETSPLLRSREAMAAGQSWAESQLAAWAPVGTNIRYVTDEEMILQVREISAQLEAEGVTGPGLTAYGAFTRLRPAAYRSDLWRVMVLWAYGGVYVDVNLRLHVRFNTWIDFDHDELVLCREDCVPWLTNRGYWNAMMASVPKSPYLEHIIQTIVGHVSEHYYGDNILDITGPGAVFKALESQGPEYRSHARIELSLTCVNYTPGIVKQNETMIADKDWRLHDSEDKTRHYGFMWRAGQAYCDEPGPEPDKPGGGGMCGSEQTV